MPKLPKKIEKAADEAELGSGFVLAKPGTYLATCYEVDTGSKSIAGNPKWVFKFKLDKGPYELDPEADAKGEIWEHCALTEDAAWKLKQIFVSMGFTLNSDSDELVGEQIGIVVVNEEIQQGKSKGKLGANAVLYFDPETIDEQVAAAS